MVKFIEWYSQYLATYVVAMKAKEPTELLVSLYSSGVFFFRAGNNKYRRNAHKWFPIVNLVNQLVKSGTERRVYRVYSC